MTTDRDRDDRDPPGHVVATRVVQARRRPLMVPAIIVIALAVAAIGFLGQKAVPPRPPTPPTTPVEPTSTPPPVAMAWTELALDPTIFRSALVGRVVSTPAGVLAFGQDKTDRHAIAWTSPDGRTWIRHDQPPGTFGGGVPDAAVRVGSSFAALGYHATANGITRDIWTSADGASWARDPSPTGRGFDEVRTLVGSHGTALLIGSIGGRPALLWSDDGRLWTAAADLDATIGRQAYIRDAIEFGRRVPGHGVHREPGCHLAVPGRTCLVARRPGRSNRVRQHSTRTPDADERRVPRVGLRGRFRGFHLDVDRRHDVGPGHDVLRRPPGCRCHPPARRG